MLFSPSENQTLPKEQTASGKARRETEARCGSVASAAVLGLSQGVSTGPFYSLNHSLWHSQG